MDHKTYELAECKADSATGTFQALASVFGNIDRGGDRMMPGAFTKTLETWRESGRPIPVILSHQHDDLHAYIGKAEPRAVYEDERGLVVQGQLDMDDPDAKKVHKLMKDGLINGWSFGYRIPKGGEKKAKDGANEISEVELFEVGPTLVGMNPEAQLEAIKNDPGLHGGDLELPTVGIVETPPEAPPEPDVEEPAPEEAQTEEPQETPAKLSAQGSLRKAHDDLVFELTTMGVDMRQPTKKDTPEPGPDPPSLDELRRRHDALTYEILTRGVAE